MSRCARFGDRLVLLVDAGKTVKQAAAEVGLSPERCSTILKAIGRPAGKPHRRHRPPGGGRSGGDRCPVHRDRQDPAGSESFGGCRIQRSPGSGGRGSDQPRGHPAKECRWHQRPLPGPGAAGADGDCGCARSWGFIRPRDRGGCAGYAISVAAEFIPMARSWTTPTRPSTNSR